MNTHDKIELPPLPADSETPASSQWEWSSQDMRDYALAAIEPYQKRIEELEAELQELRRQWVEHDTLGCPTAKTGIYAIKADRQRRGESVTCFKCGHAKHGGECVNVAPQPAEPVELDRYDAGLLGGQDGMPAYVWHDIIRAELDRAYDFYMDQLDRATPQPAEPVKVPSSFPTGTEYSVEPHGNGYAIYQGRDQFHHGLNLAHLTECTPEFAKRIESALNESAEQTDKECLSVAEPGKEPPCET